MGKVGVAGSDSEKPIQSGRTERWASVLKSRCGGPFDVNSVHGVHEAAARGHTARRDHLQCADLDESPGESGRAIPHGGRRD